MKIVIIYICAILIFISIIFYIKNTDNKSKELSDKQKTLLKFDEFVQAEIEILNGCGEKGIANLFANYLRANNYDVIDIKNATHFNYNETVIIVHNINKLPEAKNLAKRLVIGEENIQESINSIWDFSLIIGKDYDKLESFSEVNKYYNPF